MKAKRLCLPLRHSDMNQARQYRRSSSIDRGSPWVHTPRTAHVHYTSSNTAHPVTPEKASVTCDNLLNLRLHITNEERPSNYTAFLRTEQIRHEYYTVSAEIFECGGVLLIGRNEYSVIKEQNNTSRLQEPAIWFQKNSGK